MKKIKKLDKSKTAFTFFFVWRAMFNTHAYIVNFGGRSVTTSEVKDFIVKMESATGMQRVHRKKCGLVFQNAEKQIIVDITVENLHCVRHEVLVGFVSRSETLFLKDEVIAVLAILTSTWPTATTYRASSRQHYNDLDVKISMIRREEIRIHWLAKEIAEQNATGRRD